MRQETFLLIHLSFYKKAVFILSLIQCNEEGNPNQCTVLMNVFPDLQIEWGGSHIT